MIPPPPKVWLVRPVVVPALESAPEPMPVVDPPLALCDPEGELPSAALEFVGPFAALGSVEAPA